MHRCGATGREDSGAGGSLRSESEPSESPGSGTSNWLLCDISLCVVTN